MRFTRLKVARRNPFSRRGLAAHFPIRAARPRRLNPELARLPRLLLLLLLPLNRFLGALPHAHLFRLIIRRRNTARERRQQPLGLLKAFVVRRRRRDLRRPLLQLRKLPRIGDRWFGKLVIVLG